MQGDAFHPAQIIRNYYDFDFLVTAVGDMMSKETEIGIYVQKEIMPQVQDR